MRHMIHSSSPQASNFEPVTTRASYSSRFLGQASPSKIRKESHRSPSSASKSSKRLAKSPCFSTTCGCGSPATRTQYFAPRRPPGAEDAIVAAAARYRDELAAAAFGLVTVEGTEGRGAMALANLGINLRKCSGNVLKCFEAHKAALIQFRGESEKPQEKRETKWRPARRARCSRGSPR